MFPELQTERLHLRPWRPEDFAGYAEVYADHEQARFIGGVADGPAAWRRMAAELGHWLLRGYGIWAAVERSSGSLAGGVGLWEPEGWPELELSYWLRPSMQGRGFATEAGFAARAFAYDHLGRTTLVSYVDPANLASARVAQRLGARREGTVELLSFGPHDVYRHPGPDAPRADPPEDRHP